MLFAIAAPAESHLIFLRWFGDRIAAAHAVPNALGAETFSSPGRPYVAAGWFGALAAAQLMRWNALFFVAVEAVLSAGTLALVTLRAMRSSSHAVASGAVGLVLASLLVAEPARSGGELAAWFLGAALALFPASGRIAPSLIGIGALSIVWANASPLGALAPAIVLLTQLGDGASVRRAFAFAFTSIVCCLANPAGFDLFVHAPATLELDRSLMLLRPEYPSLADPVTYGLGFPLFLAAAAFAAWSRRATTGEALGTLVSLMQVFANGRYLPFAAIVMVPPIARAIAPRARALASRSHASLAIACMALAACALAYEYRHADIAFVSANREVALAATLARKPGTHRVFCLDDETYCDAFLPYAPRIRSFVDERVGAYSIETRDEAFALLTGREAWRARLNKDGIDALVLHSNNPLVTIALDGPWRPVATSGEFTLLERV